MIKVQFPEIKKWLVREEGCRYVPYDDSTGQPVKLKTGKLTVGIGRNLEAKPLSEAVIEQLFLEDVSEAISACYKIYGQDIFEGLNANQQLALIAMAFQMGMVGLSGFKKANEAVKSGQYSKAADYFAQSKWAHQDSPARADRTLKLFMKRENES